MTHIQNRNVIWLTILVVFSVWGHLSPPGHWSHLSQLPLHAEIAEESVKQIKPVEAVKDNSETLAALIQQLADPDTRQVTKAAGAIIEIGETALPSLKQALESDNKQQAKTAARLYELLSRPTYEITMPKTHWLLGEHVRMQLAVRNPSDHVLHLYFGSFLNEVYDQYHLSLKNEKGEKVPLDDDFRFRTYRLKVPPKTSKSLDLSVSDKAYLAAEGHYQLKVTVPVQQTWKTAQDKKIKEKKKDVASEFTFSVTLPNADQVKAIFQEAVKQEKLTRLRHPVYLPYLISLDEYEAVDGLAAMPYPEATRYLIDLSISRNPPHLFSELEARLPVSPLAYRFKAKKTYSSDRPYLVKKESHLAIGWDEACGKYLISQLNQFQDLVRSDSDPDERLMLKLKMSIAAVHLNSALDSGDDCLQDYLAMKTPEMDAWRGVTKRGAVDPMLLTQLLMTVAYQRQQQGKLPSVSEANSFYDQLLAVAGILIQKELDEKKRVELFKQLDLWIKSDVLAHRVLAACMVTSPFAPSDKINDFSEIRRKILPDMLSVPNAYVMGRGLMLMNHYEGKGDRAFMVRLIKGFRYFDKLDDLTKIAIRYGIEKDEMLGYILETVKRMSKPQFALKEMFSQIVERNYSGSSSVSIPAPRREQMYQAWKRFLEKQGTAIRKAKLPLDHPDVTDAMFVDGLTIGKDKTSRDHEGIKREQAKDDE